MRSKARSVSPERIEGNPTTSASIFKINRNTFVSFGDGLPKPMMIGFIIYRTLTFLKELHFKFLYCKEKNIMTLSSKISLKLFKSDMEAIIPYRPSLLMNL